MKCYPISRVQTKRGATQKNSSIARLYYAFTEKEVSQEVLSLEKKLGLVMF